APFQDSLPAPALSTQVEAPIEVSSLVLPPSSESPGERQRFMGERQIRNMPTHSRGCERTRAKKSFAVYSVGRNRRRGENVLGATVKVIGNEFLTDPCALSHDCTAAKYAEERGNRAVYEEFQNIRKDSAYAGRKPVQVFFDLLAKDRAADNEDMEDSIRGAIRQTGYYARKRAIGRNLSVALVSYLLLHPNYSDGL
ncbi:hypothetical protein GCK32_005773, partial [Trichostrongylus colubriformis]